MNVSAPQICTLTAQARVLVGCETECGSLRRPRARPKQPTWYSSSECVVQATTYEIQFPGDIRGIETPDMIGSIEADRGDRRCNEDTEYAISHTPDMDQAAMGVEA